MRERLNILISKLEVSPSKFAENLGIQRSSISHLLSGRNKPSFDFIEKLMQKYPKVNVEWLILGVGNVFKGEKETENLSLFESTTKNTVENIKKTDSLKEEASPEYISKFTDVNKLKKVILVYSDNTFSELNVREQTM